MRNSKKNNKGFTLVELLVVIAIIGILAVVAVPALFKNINKAKVADLEADYNSIKSAALSFYTDNNEYPTEGEVQNATAPAPNTSITFKSYMDTVPTKPSVSKDGGVYRFKKNTNDLVLEVTSVNMDKEQVNKLANDLGGALVKPTVNKPATEHSAITNGTLEIMLLKAN